MTFCVSSNSTQNYYHGIWMYRSLTLLNNMYNNGFAPFLFPVLKSEVEINGLFCVYAIIRFRRIINWFLASFFIVSIPFCIIQCCTTIVYMSSVYETSRKFQRRSQFLPLTVTNRAEVKRTMVSCRPLFCRVGNLFFVEKSTKLAYLFLL